MTGEELWDAISGADFFRGAIADAAREAARKLGLSLSNGDINAVVKATVAEVEKQWPDWVAEVADEVAQQQMTTGRELQRFRRATGTLGFKPKETKTMQQNMQIEGKSVEYWQAKLSEKRVT